MSGARKVLLLTGASRGIGHATVKRFSDAGWRIITCSRDAVPAECKRARDACSTVFGPIVQMKRVLTVQLLS